MNNDTPRENMHYDILSLFGKKELEDIQKRLSKVTQLGFVTVNYKGEPITSFTGFCDFCQNFRNDKELYKNCEVFDAISSLQSSIIKKPNIYKCPCGLMEIAIPIVIDDIYLGGFLCGQATCSNEPEDLIHVPPSIQNSHFTEILRQAEPQKQQLPRYTYEKFEDIAALVSMVIEMLCEKKIEQINESKNLNVKLSFFKDINKKRIDISQYIESLDYPLFLKQVKQLSQTFYKNNTIFDEKELCETISSDFSPQCLKLYPIHEHIFQNYYSLESWFIQCYDYEYRQKVIQKYKILDVVFQYINQHIKDDISLSHIVNNCNISQGYLSKLFKKCFGITVMDYIHIRKIKLAKDMINTTSMNIGDISYELGYNEPSYFSKVFKKYEGISAKEYQKEIEYLSVKEL